jgi:hypothetical protein
MIYDGVEDEIPFSPGDEEEILAYLLWLPSEERERQAWAVMMGGLPKKSPAS